MYRKRYEYDTFCYKAMRVHEEEGNDDKITTIPFPHVRTCLEETLLGTRKIAKKGLNSDGKRKWADSSTRTVTVLDMIDRFIDFLASFT